MDQVTGILISMVPSNEQHMPVEVYFLNMGRGEPQGSMDYDTDLSL